MACMDGNSSDDETWRRWPTRQGLLLERKDGSVNVAFHALALFVLTRCDLLSDKAESLADVLQRTGGVRFAESAINRQDNSLQGWSWVADTFSWVEPTAWALIALAQWRRRHADGVDTSRIEEGERLLLDRVCREGGWNYGNSNMLGADLHPHVPTTALGLLALQPRRDEEPVRRSLAWLEAHATSERSGMTLSLACLALRAYGRSDVDVRAALEAQLPVTMALGNVCSMAAASIALDPAGHPGRFAL